MMEKTNTDEARGKKYQTSRYAIKKKGTRRVGRLVVAKDQIER